MAQKPVVMAFRKRLKNTGYTNITIYKTYQNGQWTGKYIITANEPLANTKIQTELNEKEMNYKFK